MWYKKRRRYKYTLAEDFPLQLELRPEPEIVTPFVVLTTDGLLPCLRTQRGRLAARKGYAWDGPERPDHRHQVVHARLARPRCRCQLMRKFVARPPPCPGDF